MIVRGKGGGFARFQNGDDGSKLPEGGDDIQPDRQVEEVSEGADNVGADVSDGHEKSHLSLLLLKIRCSGWHRRPCRELVRKFTIDLKLVKTVRDLSVFRGVRQMTDGRIVIYQEVRMAPGEGMGIKLSRRIAYQPDPWSAGIRSVSTATQKQY